MQECDIHFWEKKNGLWFGVWSEVSQKWEGLCGRERYRHMGHTSLSEKDKVFPNEDLLGFLPIPETIDVHSIPARIRPQAIKHCWLVWNALQIKYSNHLNCQLKWFRLYEKVCSLLGTVYFLYFLLCLCHLSLWYTKMWMLCIEWAQSVCIHLVRLALQLCLIFCTYICYVCRTTAAQQLNISENWKRGIQSPSKPLQE